ALPISPGWSGPVTQDGQPEFFLCSPVVAHRRAQFVTVTVQVDLVTAQVYAALVRPGDDVGPVSDSGVGPLKQVVGEAAALWGEQSDPQGAIRQVGGRVPAQGVAEEDPSLGSARPAGEGVDVAEQCATHVHGAAGPLGTVGVAVLGPQHVFGDSAADRVLVADGDAVTTRAAEGDHFVGHVDVVPDRFQAATR